jgi:hypothetical protein
MVNEVGGLSGTPPLRRCESSPGEPGRVAGGGNVMGEGARDGCVEWMWSVESPPRNGLVEGVIYAPVVRAGADSWTGMGRSSSVLRGEGESSEGTNTEG